MDDYAKSRETELKQLYNELDHLFLKNQDKLKQSFDTMTEYEQDTWIRSKIEEFATYKGISQPEEIYVEKFVQFLLLVIYPEQIDSRYTVHEVFKAIKRAIDGS